MDSTRQHYLLNDNHDGREVLRDRPHEGELDGVYARHARTNPFKPNGFVEHVTMGPEAMVALGIGAHVENWLTLQHTSTTAGRMRVRYDSPPRAD